jgi:hypothetical protein
MKVDILRGLEKAPIFLRASYTGFGILFCLTELLFKSNCTRNRSWTFYKLAN